MTILVKRRGEVLRIVSCGKREVATKVKALRAQHPGASLEVCEGNEVNVSGDEECWA